MNTPIYNTNTLPEKESNEDIYQGVLMTSLVDGINTSGIISSNNVNTGLLLGDD